MDTTPVAHLNDLEVRGAWNDGVAVFRGIPYATADRFAPPVAAATASDLDATDFGPIAPQVAGAQFQRADLVQAEQCLSLNVWTPGADDARRPILVWIHGGGFRTGSGASPLYEGSTLAARGDVVVVTINYRLGLLGFLGHPDLAAGDGAPCANWGMLDCVEALRWVRTHGGAFGGDPDDVTIFGESAGAAAVALLCTMPAARGLFRKAAVQSGAPLTSSIGRAARLAERAAEVAGVDGVAGLRDLPVDRILTVQQQVEAEGADRTFIPAVDGSDIPTRPGVALRDGSAAGIPLLIGSNVDEWKLWAAADPHSRDLDEDRLRSRLERSFPAASLDGLIDTVRDARAARGEGVAPNDLFYAIESERVFRVPATRVADVQSAHASTFVYLFAWGSPAMRGWLGACHGLEIAFVFGNQGRGELAAFTGSGPGADALAEQMMDAWLAFVRTGSPSVPSLPWPRHDPATRPTMVFDATSGLQHAPRDAERAIVDALVPRPR
jgi:para-nitrobenzyl esterase